MLSEVYKEFVLIPYYIRATTLKQSGQFFLNLKWVPQWLTFNFSTVGSSFKPSSGFIKTGKHVDKHGVKVNVPKAAERLTGKPHVDHGIKKRNKESKKAFKSAKGKASGGRIGLKHGSSAQSHYLQHGYGPTKTRLRTGKPKIAIKGWS